MIKNKRILVTGGSGFLGKFLVEKLKQNKNEVVISNTSQHNLLNYNLLKYNLEKYRFDFIFHLAAFVHAGDWQLSHMADVIEINQEMNANILRYWKECQMNATFVAMGTSCSYPNDLPRIEKNYLNGTPEESLEYYAYTKRLLYLSMKAYNKQYGMNYYYFVPPTLFGEGFSDRDDHFIYDLIRKIYNAKYHNIEPVILWGNGEQKRELIYVGDAVDKMFDIMYKEKYNKIYNLPSGDVYSIKDYAKFICDILDYDYNKIKFDETKYTGMLSNQLGNNLSFINLDAEMDKRDIFVDNLRKVVNYYLNKMEN